MEPKAGMPAYDARPADKDPGPAVLIVDNDAMIRGSHRVALKSSERGDEIQVFEAESIDAALDILSRTRIHVILLDKDLGKGSDGVEVNGIRYIPQFLAMQSHVQILVITGSDNDADEIEAMDLGAIGFVRKRSPELLVAQINRALRAATQQFFQTLAARNQLGHTILPKSLGGKSMSWMRAVSLAEIFARTDACVLITGEPGTGKSQLARLIHEYRKAYLKEEAKQFIAIDIGNLSSTLAERELFGNEKWAYTDAKEANAGYFELANHGTLFIDEIGNASPELQQKLLKVIAEKTFYRLGGKVALHSEFKLICATNANLQEMVDKKTFRKDLFGRIATLEIVLDPISKRREDIPEIVRALLPEVCSRSRVAELPFEKLPKDFIAYLQNAELPENIRSINHLLYRLITGCSATRDHVDVALLLHWREILQNMDQRGGSASAGNAVGGGPLGIEEFLKRDLDWIGPNFQGLHDAVELFSKKLFDEAQRKYKTNNAIARVMKISNSTASGYLGRYQKGTRVRKRRGEG